MALYKNGSFVEDHWTTVAEGDAISPAGHVIIPLDWWLAERQAFVGSNVPLGLRVEPGTDIEDFAQEINRFAVIALSFPKFGDGRAFSTACLLRERYGYTGELRAVGEVLLDQIQAMARCGFDAFEVTDAATLKALSEGYAQRVTHFYQPSSAAVPVKGDRPWLWRAAR